LEPTLVLIGINHRTAPVEVRERFWMSEERQRQALSDLVRGEGIEEALVFSTCNRTEFVVWGDATLAANSVLRFLTAHYDLKLCEWRNFYRLLDEQALAHAFRVSCGLDSMRLGEGQIARQVNAAWQLAKSEGTTGVCIDSLLQKALAVRRRVRRETALGTSFTSVPKSALELATDLFGSLADRKILLIGAGKMAEAVGQAFICRDERSICVVNRTDARAAELARRIGIQASSYERQAARIAAADLVITATAASEFVLTVDQMKQVAAQRQDRNVVFIDLGLPRNIDPRVRELGGVLLYDMNDLERRAAASAEMWQAELEAEKIVVAEAQGFRQEILMGGGRREIVALRARLDEICRQELESFRLEQGPFPKEQDQLIAAVSARITHKIAGSLAREMKGSPENRPHGHATASA